MSEPEPPYLCSVCNQPFDLNPRLQRWLAGHAPAKELSKACMCWVCARLTASVEKDAKDEAAYFGREE